MAFLSRPAVLADALHVVPGVRPPPSLSLREGEPFELRCVTSTASPLHTHLALLWELHRGPVHRPVVALTHQGRFHPGPGYEQRYHSGDVRLDTVGSDAYRLSVSRALSADQGSYKCVISEWIAEQGNWQEIQEKAVEVATVVIQPTGELRETMCYRLSFVTCDGGKNQAREPAALCLCVKPSLGCREQDGGGRLGRGASVLSCILVCIAPAFI
jgi:hypothetical protein